jgi:rieske iron-sulfur protein
MASILCGKPVASDRPAALACPSAEDSPAAPGRRVLLGGCLAMAAGLSWPAQAGDADDPARTMRPQKGDLLVHFEGDHEGAVIKPTDLKAGDPPVTAWAFDPQKKVPRDGSRLNLILMVRLDPATITGEEEAHAAEGVVAFSATCTHQQCPVTEWLTGPRHFRCPCHQSEFDPAQNARVVAGPAPRPLPPLPLMIADGQLQVAGSFIGHVGGERPTGM